MRSTLQLCQARRSQSMQKGSRNPLRARPGEESQIPFFFDCHIFDMDKRSGENALLERKQNKIKRSISIPGHYDFHPSIPKSLTRHISRHQKNHSKGRQSRSSVFALPCSGVAISKSHNGSESESKGCSNATGDAYPPW